MTVRETQKQFMLEEASALFQTLKADTTPRFGLMTAQHMVEHLILTTKMCSRRVGEVINPPTKGQLGFKAFIDKGAVFQYRPSEKTAADLPPLKYDSLEAALAELPKAIAAFYQHYEENPDFKCYNDFLGEIAFAELDLFTYMHYRHHLYQFHLLESYT